MKQRYGLYGLLCLHWCLFTKDKYVIGDGIVVGVITYWCWVMVPAKIVSGTHVPNDFSSESEFDEIRQKCILL